MVLEMKAPHEADVPALRPVLPAFLSYVLSLVFVRIYWNNHHHVFHFAQRVSGMLLWANLHLLFWLSLVPLVTGRMGQSHFSTWPVARAIRKVGGGCEPASSQVNRLAANA